MVAQSLKLAECYSASILRIDKFLNVVYCFLIMAASHHFRAHFDAGISQAFLHSGEVVISRGLEVITNWALVLLFRR